MRNNPKSSTERLNVTLQSSVLQMIDDYALNLGISRSAAISVLCVQAINANNGIQALKEIQDLASRFERNDAKQVNQQLDEEEGAGEG